MIRRRSPMLALQLIQNAAAWGVDPRPMRRLRLIERYRPARRRRLNNRTTRL